MPAENPYSTPRTNTARTLLHSTAPSRVKWATTGFFIVWAAFATLGCFGLYQDHLYALSLPPGQPRCGNGAFAAMLCIFPVGPFFGSLGALAGLVLANIVAPKTNP